MATYADTPLANIDDLPMATARTLTEVKGWRTVGDLAKFVEDGGDFESLSIENIVLNSGEIAALDAAVLDFNSTPDPMLDPIENHFIFSDGDSIPVAIKRLGVTTMIDLFVLTHHGSLINRALYDPGERLAIRKFFEDRPAWRRPTSDKFDAMAEDILMRCDASSIMQAGMAGAETLHEAAKISGADDDVADGEFSVVGSVGDFATNDDIKSLREAAKFRDAVIEAENEVERLEKAFESKKASAIAAKKEWNEAQKELSSTIRDFRRGQKTFDLKADSPVDGKEAKGKKEKGKKPKKEQPEVSVRAAKSTSAEETWRELPAATVTNDKMALKKLANSGLTTVGQCLDWANGEVEGSPPIKMKTETMAAVKRAFVDFGHSKRGDARSA